MAHAFHEDDGADDPRVFARELVDIAASTTRAHPHANRVRSAAAGAPTMGEAVRFFALLHAGRPSMAAATADRADDPWLTRFTAAFERERDWLAHAALFAAPPRRRDLVRHELLVGRQREAMLTLAASDRLGCALGAAVALAADWPGVRLVLAPDEPVREVDPGLVDVLAAAGATPSARRAIGFGVVQMLTMHQSLWDLLEAREAASLP